MSLTVPCQLLLTKQAWPIQDIQKWTVGATIILHAIPQEAATLSIQNQPVALAMPLLVDGHIAAELKTWPAQMTKTNP